MLTLLTATGCRPQAWALCERWMMAQTYTGPVRWVIVDDGVEKQLVTFNRDGWEIDLVWPDHVWKPGMNTQAANLLAGLEHVGENDRLVIIEDDDHYAPDWLTQVDRQLNRAELVGEKLARYYNIQTQTGRQLRNDSHASLCSTAMRGKAIKTFRSVCAPGVKFIDLSLWRKHHDKQLFDGHRVTGIKGFPGREGIGMGHKPEFKGAADPDWNLLREWIGNDAEHYQHIEETA